MDGWMAVNVEMKREQGMRERKKSAVFEAARHRGGWLTVHSKQPIQGAPIREKRPTLHRVSHHPLCQGAGSTL